MPNEQTLVLIKPEAVARRLTGRILGRFEDMELRVIRANISIPSRELATNHYPTSTEWLESVGSKALADCAARDVDPVNAYGSSDPQEIGLKIKKGLVDYLTSGPVFSLVLEGNAAVQMVRNAVGATFPLNAAPGTIRADFSTDTAETASSEGRPVRNVVHASGTVQEAQEEIGLWFPQKSS